MSAPTSPTIDTSNLNNVQMTELNNSSSLLPNTPTSAAGPGPSRDLKLAKKAHKEGDIEASIAAHQVFINAGDDGNSDGDGTSSRGLRPHTAAAENHNTYYISLVVGLHNCHFLFVVRLVNISRALYSEALME